MRGAGAPVVVFSMGKTGSTAIARAVQDATGDRVFQVFRLEADAARARPSSATARAEHARRRRRGSVPGRAAPLGVGVSAAAPADRRRAVDRHHDGARADRAGGVGVLPRQPAGAACSRATRPSTRSPRRCSPRSGCARRCAGSTASSRPRSASTCSRTPFDPALGHGVIGTPAARVLVLRQENLDAAPAALGRVPRPRRRRCRSRPATRPRPRSTPARYREFLGAVRLPEPVLDEVYGSRYARHFYADSELERFPPALDARSGRGRPRADQAVVTPRVQSAPSGLVTMSAEEGAGMDDSDKGDASGASGSGRRSRPRPRRRSAAWYRDPREVKTNPSLTQVPPRADVGRRSSARLVKIGVLRPRTADRRARPPLVEGPVRLPRHDLRDRLRVDVGPHRAARQRRGARDLRSRGQAARRRASTSRCRSPRRTRSARARRTTR